MTPEPAATARVLHHGIPWSPLSRGEHHAVAIDGGVIVALDDEALAWGETNRAAFHHLGRRFDMPAFDDGHAHPLFGGLEADGPQVRGHDSVAGIVEEVARYAGELPELEWI